MTLFGIALGAGIGAVLRYLLTNLGKSLWPGRPWATLIINVCGAFLVGLLPPLILNQMWRLIVITGFCGGFTTFSTFELDTIVQLHNHHLMLAVSYCVLTVACGLVAFVLGSQLF
jgi:CrcB protein